MRQFRSVVVAVAISAASGFAVALDAMPADGVDAGRLGALTSNLGDPVVQASRIAIDVDAMLASARVPGALRGHAGETHVALGRQGMTLRPERVESHPAVGAETVLGKVESGGQFLISRSVDGATGAVWAAGMAYDLINMGETDELGRLVFEVRPVPRDLPECDGAEIAEDMPPHAGASTRNDPDVNVRVLIAFSPDVKQRFNLASFAASAISSANNAYANSQIAPMQMELAGFIDMKELPPVRDSASLLRMITCSHDGFWDEAHILRNHTAADVVACIVDMTGSCGRAYLSPTNPNRLFSVTDPDCAIGGLTFAHEVGHNFGAAHDPDNAGSSYASYAYGHRWTGTGGTFRSVMAYSPGTRVPYFSNPNVLYAGQPTGIANQRDNARLHNTTAPILANARSGPGAAFVDCNGNGIDDFLEILLNPDLDLDFDGVIDACQIAADPSLDCNNNGILDSVEVRPTTRMRFGPFVEVAPGQPRNFVIPATELLDSDLTITIGGKGNFNGSTRFVILRLGNPGEQFTVNVPLNMSSCNVDGGVITVTVPYSAVAGMLPGIPVELDVSAAATPTCTWNSLNVRVEYTSQGAIDSDGNGVPDNCECSADVTGPSLDGVPDGRVNSFDLNYFIMKWIVGQFDYEPVADVTGPALDGVPDGVVNAFDLNYYVALWLEQQLICN